MHRFFVSADNIKDHKVYIDDVQARHIEKVLRLKPGDYIAVFDGSGGEYRVKLSGREKGLLSAEIEGEVIRHAEADIELSLVQGIARGDKMDTIIQKATEIGVKSIYPLMSERSVVKMEGEKANKKRDRWQLIAREACKQCRRNIVPEIKPLIDFTGLLQELENKTSIMLYENEKARGLKSLLRDKRDSLISQPLFLLLGPEGGFSPQEVEEARKRGVVTVGLGPRILRTETAAIVSCGIIMYELGQLE